MGLWGAMAWPIWASVTAPVVTIVEGHPSFEFLGPRGDHAVVQVVADVGGEALHPLGRPAIVAVELQRPDEQRCPTGLGHHCLMVCAISEARDRRSTKTGFRGVGLFLLTSH